MKSSESTFKPLKNQFLIKIFKSYFLVKTVLKNLVPFKRCLKKSDVFFNILKSMCYYRLCVDMFFLCVIKMTLCKKYHPLKTLAIPCPFPSVLVPFFLFLEIYCNIQA